METASVQKETTIEDATVTAGECQSATEAEQVNLEPGMVCAGRRICVVADDREGGAGALEALRGIKGIDVEVRRLPIGDYEVDGRLVVERKTLTDLVASIQDARLFRQSAALAGVWSGSSRRPLVILEGTARDLAGNRMRREAIQGALITLTLIYGIPLLRSAAPDETARLMIYAARQMRAVARGGLTRSGTRPQGKRARQLRILQGLPRVGPERAARLLERFGTVERIMTATESQLKEVEGVGRRTADAIRWAVSDPEAAYEAAEL